MVGGECKGCKRVREHVASLLPFRVLEAAVGKPLRISGVALSAGVSRNFNVYTVEELQAFASELLGSPMYIEHVAVPNAVGKVTKAFYDSVSRCLMYEAEVYDQALADKIRNGLIQHVSVGADYDALDLVDAKVPHGLHNAELSLVAVPGVPEANIQVLERLRESLAHPGSSKFKLPIKELLEPLTCVFCGQPGEYLVSVCTSCGDKADAIVNGHLPAASSAGPGAQSGVEKLEEKELKELIKAGVAEGLKVREQSDADKQAQIDRSQNYGIGIKKGGNVTKPSEFASISDDEFADAVNYRYPVDKDHAQAALAYFNQADNRTDYSAEEQAKIMAKIVQGALAAGVEVTYQPNDAVYKALPEELKAKCKGYVKEATDAEKLADTTSKLTVAEKTVEELRKQVPGGGLLVNPPKMMPVAEHVAVLEGLLPPPMVERSTMGMQRQGQAIRAALLQANEKLKAK